MYFFAKLFPFPRLSHGRHVESYITQHTLFLLYYCSAAAPERDKPDGEKGKRSRERERGGEPYCTHVLVHIHMHVQILFGAVVCYECTPANTTD